MRSCAKRLPNFANSSLAPANEGHGWRQCSTGAVPSLYRAGRPVVKLCPVVSHGLSCEVSRLAVVLSPLAPLFFFFVRIMQCVQRALGQVSCDRLCSDRFAACIDPFSCAANSAPSCTVRSCVVALGHARRSFFLSFEIFVFLILSFRVFQPLKKPFFTRCIVFQHFSEHCSGLCAKCMVTGVAIVNLVVPPMTALALSFFSGCRGG